MATELTPEQQRLILETFLGLDEHVRKAKVAAWLRSTAKSAVESLAACSAGSYVVVHVLTIQNVPALRLLIAEDPATTGWTFKTVSQTATVTVTSAVVPLSTRIAERGVARLFVSPTSYRISRPGRWTGDWTLVIIPAKGAVGLFFYVVHDHADAGLLNMAVGLYADILAADEGSS